MPKTRKQKERMIGNVPDAIMRAAVADVNRGLGLRVVSRQHNIPLTTLRRYWQKFKQSSENGEMAVHFTPNYEVGKSIKIRDYENNNNLA